MRDPGLWDRILAHPLALTTGGLEVGIAKFTLLQGTRAKEAVYEYRRFLYLVAITDYHLAPPTAIDAVWRLHLGDPRAYVEDFCKPVFGRVIQHAPSGADPAKDPAYMRTRTLYRAEFGEEPAYGIWPSPLGMRAEVWVIFAMFAGVILGVWWLLGQGSVPVGVAGIALLTTAFLWKFFFSPWPVSKGGEGVGTWSGGWSGSDSGGAN